MFSAGLFFENCQLGGPRIAAPGTARLLPHPPLGLQKSLIRALEPPGTSPERSITAQDAPRPPQDAAKTLQDAPKTPQDVSKTRFWWVLGAKMEPSWHQNRIRKQSYVKTA